MVQTKKARSAIIFGSLFGVIAILFAVLNYFNVIKTLDMLLAVTYISYFLGLSFFYLAVYCKEKGYIKSRTLSFLAGFAFLGIAIVLLIYGFVTGNISFFNFNF